MAPLLRTAAGSLPLALLACAAGPARPPRFPPGESRLGLGEARDGLVYVPRRPSAAGPAPLVVFLHGAGGNARAAMPILRDLAEANGFVVLVPESRGKTWDVIEGELGPDVDFLRRALAEVNARIPVDGRRVALAGFSDGASYALTVGLLNRDVFTHVIAFSPGFGAAPARKERRPVFVSHGGADPILPVKNARAIVERLRERGFEVTYREFDGGHRVPEDVAREAVRWFLGG